MPSCRVTVPLKVQLRSTAGERASAAVHVARADPAAGIGEREAALQPQIALVLRATLSYSPWMMLPASSIDFDQTNDASSESRDDRLRSTFTCSEL